MLSGGNNRPTLVDYRKIDEYQRRYLLVAEAAVSCSILNLEAKVSVFADHNCLPKDNGSFCGACKMTMNQPAVAASRLVTAFLIHEFISAGISDTLLAASSRTRRQFC